MGDFWKKLNLLIPADEGERERSRQLFHEFQHRGYLSLTNRKLLELPLCIIIDFFKRSEALHRGSSPVSRRRDSRWMGKSDFCFFNIRSAGAGRDSGDIIRATILLTPLRTNCIHLAPFTASEGENINAPLSHSHINENIVNKELKELGISGEEQLSGFISAAHSLKMMVGMDLPLTLSPRGEVLLHRPELFRWIKLDPSHPFTLEGGQPFTFEIEKQSQQIHAEKIKKLVEKKRTAGISYSEIGLYLKEEGYYPVPVNEKRGKGVPFFITYDKDEREPLFTNSSQKSQMTTFLFTHPGKEGERVENVEAEKYFSRIFPLWQNRINPDFIYFDSLAPSFKDDIPYNEAPTAEQVKRFTQAASDSKQYTGIMTSGSSDELAEYAQAGIDLIIDRHVSLRQDKEYMERLLRINTQIKEFNEENHFCRSVLFPLGQPDQNSHTGLQRVRRNHFLSRFLGCGSSWRGKYELMGFNDGSSGVVPSLNKIRNLEWSENREHLLSYHNLEDIYAREKHIIEKGEIIHTYLDDRVFWWVIKAGKNLLIPLISVENNDMLPPNRVEINLDPFINTRNSPTIMEYDFESPTGNLILFMGGKLPLERIPYRSSRLFTIK